MPWQEFLLSSLLNSAVDYIPVGVFLFSIATQNFTSIDIDRVMVFDTGLHSNSFLLANLDSAEENPGNLIAPYSASAPPYTQIKIVVTLGEYLWNDE